MSVAVCTLGCDRKIDELHSWPSLTELDGDYSLYINYEFREASKALRASQIVEALPNAEKLKLSFDMWSWETAYGYNWRKRPKFDQDQSRLSSIVCARNMCIEYAMQTDASHLLFVDADIIPPKDIIPKLLEVDHPAVAGLVHGRGVHKECSYIFGEKQRFKKNGIDVIEAEHANIGFCMLSRKLFEGIRMRWGNSHYPDGRVSMTSDDPAYHLDAYIKFGEWMVIRPDVVGNHIGDLKAGETSQF
jgi:hypothetical protein